MLITFYSNICYNFPNLIWPLSHLFTLLFVKGCWRFFFRWFWKRTHRPECEVSDGTAGSIQLLTQFTTCLHCTHYGIWRYVRLERNKDDYTYVFGKTTRDASFRSTYIYIMYRWVARVYDNIIYELCACVSVGGCILFDDVCRAFSAKTANAER